MINEYISSREERTLLVDIVDDLKDRLKVAKPLEASFLTKEIKRYKARLLRLQREAVNKHKHSVDKSTVDERAGI